MRAIDTHKVNGLNEALNVTALDEPGHGGACHRYKISFYGTPPGYEGTGVATGTKLTEINFQNGPVAEAGVNGVSHEALLAILMDRLSGFQSGPYACNENAIALAKLVEAMEILQSRTRERIARKVEGTSAL